MGLRKTKQRAMSTELVVGGNAVPSVYGSKSAFEQAWVMASSLADTTMVPTGYQGNPNNVMIALEYANRVGASPLAVMQNLHIIEGRPSWSSPFIIGAIESCGRFGPLRYRITDRGEKATEITVWTGPKGQRTTEKKTVKYHDKACVAYATELRTGEELEGPEVSIEMAVAEGWYTKSGSKWQTMPDLMLRYRAAAFFGRLYASAILMGMHTEEEVIDITDVQISSQDVPKASNSALENLNNAAKSKTASVQRGVKPEKHQAATNQAQPVAPASAAASPQAQTSHIDDAVIIPEGQEFNADEAF